MNAIGQAEVGDLGLDGGPLYDPVANYNRVSRRGSDFGDDPTPAPVATRTRPDVIQNQPLPDGTQPR